MILLFVEPIIYLALALYLNEVVPQTYGVPRHPCFCIRDSRAWCRRRRLKKDGFFAAAPDEIEDTATDAQFDYGKSPAFEMIQILVLRMTTARLSVILYITWSVRTTTSIHWL